MRRPILRPTLQPTLISRPVTPPRPARLPRVALAGLMFAGVAAGVQAQAPLADGHLTLFGGPAFQTGAGVQPYELGISADANLFRLGGGALRAGALAEGGFYHPAISGKGNYYFSADGVMEFLPRAASIGAPIETPRTRPFLVVGYTKRFDATETSVTSGDGVNFGIGADRAIEDDVSLRVELHDCYMPSTNSHALVLRVGLATALWFR